MFTRSCASGSIVIAASAKSSRRFSNTMKKIPETLWKRSSVLIIFRAGRIVFLVENVVPETMPSASSMWTIIVPKKLIPSGLFRSFVACAFVVKSFPFRSSKSSFAYFSVSFDFFGFIIFTSSQSMWKFSLLANALIFRGSPIRIGFASPPFTIFSVASITRGSSPSGKTIFFGFFLADARTLRKNLCIGIGV